MSPVDVRAHLVDCWACGSSGQDVSEGLQFDEDTGRSYFPACRTCDGEGKRQDDACDCELCVTHQEALEATHVS